MLVVVEMNFPLDLFLVAVGATDIQMAIPALAPLRQPFSALSMHFVFFFFFSLISSRFVQMQPKITWFDGEKKGG